MIFIVPFHIDIHLLWLYGLSLLVGGGGDMLEEGKLAHSLAIRSVLLYQSRTAWFCQCWIGMCLMDSNRSTSFKHFKKGGVLGVTE